MCKDLDVEYEWVIEARGMCVRAAKAVDERTTGCGSHMEATWKSRGSNVEATWKPRGGHKKATWKPRGSYLEAMWKPRGSHMNRPDYGQAGISGSLAAVS